MTGPCIGPAVTRLRVHGRGRSQLNNDPRAAASRRRVTAVGAERCNGDIACRALMLKGHKSYASAAELLCVVLLGALLTRLVPIPGIPKDDSILSVVSRVIASNEVRATPPTRRVDAPKTLARDWIGLCPLS
jgi:hypothetical protein